MKAGNRFIGSAVLVGGLMMLLPLASLADKGGKPNNKSVATTAACINQDGDAQVYSCKGLSNVVLWCGGSYVKHDDIKDEEGNEVYQAVFGCEDSDGNAIDGDIEFIAIKSGSQKHAKHNDDYDSPEGLPDEPPSGSGIFTDDIPSCPLEPAQVPVPGDCDAEPTEPPPPILG